MFTHFDKLLLKSVLFTFKLTDVLFAGQKQNETVLFTSKLSTDSVNKSPSFVSRRVEISLTILLMLSVIKQILGLKRKENGKHV